MPFSIPFSNSNPNMDGTANAGTSGIAARADHVHPTDTTRLATDASNGPVTGDLAIGSNSSNRMWLGTYAGTGLAALAHESLKASTTEYALLQAAAGNTYVNSGGTLYLCNNDSVIAQITSSGMTMSTEIAMGSHKITGLAAASTNGDAVRYEQIIGLVTAKGDIIAATGSGAPARVAVGSDGKYLMADSSASAGVSWGDAPAEISPTWTTMPNGWSGAEQNLCDFTPSRSGVAMIVPSCAQVANAGNYGSVTITIKIKTGGWSGTVVRTIETGYQLYEVGTNTNYLDYDQPQFFNVTGGTHYYVTISGSVISGSASFNIFGTDRGSGFRQAALL